MVGINVTITKYISDDPQPGIVEGKFKDAWNNEFTLVEKTVVLSTELLVKESNYPREGFVACEVVEKWTDKQGRKLVKIDLEKPWGVETVDGLSKFDIEERNLICLT